MCLKPIHLPAAVLGLACTILPSTVRSTQPPKDKDDLERTVDRALAYLHKSQEPDGAWRLSGSKNCAATSLAVMAFLSAGHTPDDGPYGRTVSKGIRWVLNSQQSNGIFASSGHVMYEHGISTLMLAEVVGMTRKEVAGDVREALEKAVKVILRAQRSGGYGSGGWRYTVVGYDADVSVTGWQLLALKAAKNVGCDIPGERILAALQFLRRCQDPATGGFRYRPGAQLTVACTGTAALCLELCDKHNTILARRAGAYLLKNPPAWNDPHFFYTIYYCSQATFQLGGNYWTVYRPRLHKVVMPEQKPDGSFEAERYGKAYATAMTVLALTVEYRFLPIYQRGKDSLPSD